MPSNLNTDSPKEVARQRFALAVETLSNIHYLIEQDRDDPDSVKKFVEMAEPAMGVLRDLVRDDGMRLRSSTELSTSPSMHGAADGSLGSQVLHQLLFQHSPCLDE
jgi:hypothetical protein